jgi:hypothetical protein
MPAAVLDPALIDREPGATVLREGRSRDHDPFQAVNVRLTAMPSRAPHRYGAAPAIQERG